MAANEANTEEPMSENTETTGAPEGYAPCPKKCGRWMARQQLSCWRCFWPNAHAGLFSLYDSAGCGDRTPPIAQPPAPRTQKLLACEHCKAMQKVQPATDAVMCATCYAAGHSLRALTSLPPAAAHVERRAGQRWRSDSMLGSRPYVVEGTLSNLRDFGGSLSNGWELADATVNGQPSTEMVFYDAVWDISGRTMTLITDAPPEPAKPHTCRDHCGALHCDCSKCGHDPALYRPAQEAPTFRDVLCSGGCGLRICLVSPLTWTCPTCVRKRTEAPKAVPVCIAMGGLRERCATGLTPVARMDGGSKPIMVCDGHWLMREQSIEVSMGFDAAKQATGLTGDPAIGERLPRPQLAADWVEDCLPTVWR